MKFIDRLTKSLEEARWRGLDPDDADYEPSIESTALPSERFGISRGGGQCGECGGPCFKRQTLCSGCQQIGPDLTANDYANVEGNPNAPYPEDNKCHGHYDLNHLNRAGVPSPLEWLETNQGSGICARCEKPFTDYITYFIRNTKNKSL